jgi:tetratricopeptide (TPR) repeat protein
MPVEGHGAPGTDPDRVADIEGFVEALSRLRAHAGSPPYRTLARLVGPLLRPPREVPFRTVADAFQPGRRRLDLDLVVAIVRALGVDEPGVEAWRRACVRVQSEARTGGPIGVFRQLPAELPTFTGRAALLRRLIGSAGGAGPDGPGTVVISAIEGMGGVGKTQLALRAAHELVRSGRFGDLQLYANLRGFDPDHPPADPSAVLDAFLRQLEVPTQYIPETLEERAAMLRDQLHGKSALILLDNAADENQVRSLIPAAPGCLVLLTSRRTLTGLDGAEVYELDVFDEAEAVELLGRIAGRDRAAAEPEAAAAIARACGYLPLAVALAGARLRTRASWTFADLAERLHAGDLDTVKVGGRSLTAVFDLSYQGLADRARRTFRLLGLCPSRDFTAPAVAALTGTSTAEAVSVLEELQDEHLLQQQVAGRYSFHDLVAVYAHERAVRDEPAAAREAAVTRLVHWYIHSVSNAADFLHTTRVRWRLELIPPVPSAVEFADMDGALAWLLAERANLAVVIAYADDELPGPECWILAAQTLYFSFHRSLWSEMYTSHKVGLRCAERHGDPVGLALMLSGVAWALKMLGHAEESFAMVRRYVAAAEASGDDRLIATATVFYADALSESGQNEEAAENYRAALAALYALDAPQQLAAVKVNFAILLRENLGLAEQAEEHLHEALQLLRRVHSPLTEVYVLTQLARTRRRLGDLDTAIKHHAQAAMVSERIGNVAEQARSLTFSAEVLLEAGRISEAREAFTAARALQQAHPEHSVTEYMDRLEKELRAAEG